MSRLSTQYHSLYILTDTVGEDYLNTWDDLHLVPTTRPLVNPPEVFQNLVKVPGADGFVDLTDILANRPIYGPRTGSWEFIAHPDYSLTEPWEVKYSKILRYFHDRRCLVKLEDDRGYMYSGRIKVNQWKSDPNWSQVTLDYTLDPYKRSVGFYDEPWLWDPFNFYTGIIDDAATVRVGNYMAYPISGNTTVEIANGDQPVSPEIIVSTQMTVADNVQTSYANVYTLSSGSNKIPELVLAPGVNKWVFTGSGTARVHFRQGWL